MYSAGENADITQMKLAFFLSILLLLSVANSFAISPEVQKYLYYETKGNAAAKRDTKKIMIKHLEIPLKVMETDFSVRFLEEIKSSLIFEKNGEKYVRWIINPEDTKWKNELIQFLKGKKLSTKEFEYFEAYQTASRSYVIHDPNTKATFSLKVSTNVTGGSWRDKKQTMADSFETRTATDYIQKIHKNTPFENFKMLDEPAAFGIKEIDQGMMVRSLHELPKGDFIYLPGFSAVHEKIGKEIAKTNGATDVAKFWNEHYNKPLARSLAELAAKAGVSYDSPHSQNFLIELDRNLRPTGKLILKDMGDIYLNEKMVKAFGGEKLINAFPDENKFASTIKAKVGILHGNTVPSWLTDKQYVQWGDDFYKEYDKELTKITGTSISELPKKWERQFFPQNMYFNKEIETDSDGWKKYIAKMARSLRAGEQKSVNEKLVECNRSFARIQ
jgi:hypothetical protein